MAITVNGVLCDEIVDGYSEGVDFRDGPSARKGFICNWTDRYKVANGLLGLNKASLVGGRITISVPAAFPEIPYMYCHTIEFEPKGSPIQSSPQLAWPKVIVWANYKCTPWSFSGLDDPSGQNQFPGANYIYAEQQLNSSAEIAYVAGHSAKFKTSGKLAGFDVGFRLSLVDMIITFHRVPYLPAAQAFNMAGMINNGTFLGVATGQCMFNGYRTNQARNTDGTVATDVTAIYQGRSIRWDYGFDPTASGGAGGWDQVVWPNGTTPFIQMADLSATIPSSYID